MNPRENFSAHFAPSGSSLAFYSNCQTSVCPLSPLSDSALSINKQIVENATLATKPWGQCYQIMSDTDIIDPLAASIDAVLQTPINLYDCSYMDKAFTSFLNSSLCNLAFSGTFFELIVINIVAVFFFMMAILSNILYPHFDAQKDDLPKDKDEETAGGGFINRSRQSSFSVRSDRPPVLPVARHSKRGGGSTSSKLEERNSLMSFENEDIRPHNRGEFVIPRGFRKDGSFSDYDERRNSRRSDTRSDPRASSRSDARSDPADRRSEDRRTSFNIDGVVLPTRRRSSNYDERRSSKSDERRSRRSYDDFAPGPGVRLRGAEMDDRRSHRSSEDYVPPNGSRLGGSDYDERRSMMSRSDYNDDRVTVVSFQRGSDYDDRRSIKSRSDYSDSNFDGRSIKSRSSYSENRDQPASFRRQSDERRQQRGGRDLEYPDGSGLMRGRRPDSILETLTEERYASSEPRRSSSAREPTDRRVIQRRSLFSTSYVPSEDASPVPTVRRSVSTSRPEEFVQLPDSATPPSTTPPSLRDLYLQQLRMRTAFSVFNEAPVTQSEAPLDEQREKRRSGRSVFIAAENV